MMERSKSSKYQDFKVDTFPFEIDNGYLTGYEMLHGTSNFSILNVKGEYDKKTDTYSFNYTLEWKDTIDPNTTQGDMPYAEAAKSLPTADPTDYKIRIIWSQSVKLKGSERTNLKGTKYKTYDNRNVETSRGRNRSRL